MGFDSRWIPSTKEAFSVVYNSTRDFGVNMSVNSSYPIRAAAMQPVTKITRVGLRFGVVALTLYWLAIFVGTHLPAGSSISPRGNDKVMHFSAYFLLGLLLCYVTTSERLWQRFGLIAAGAMAYAAMDEATQALVPGRYPDPLDFAADSAGVLSAIGVYLLARYLFRDRLATR
jgi:VanZ family protein